MFCLLTEIDLETNRLMGFLSGIKIWRLIENIEYDVSTWVNHQPVNSCFKLLV